MTVNDINSYKVPELACLHLCMLIFITGLAVFVAIAGKKLSKELWKHTIKRNMKLARRRRLAKETGTCQCKSCRKDRKQIARKRIEKFGKPSFSLTFKTEPAFEAIYI